MAMLREAIRVFAGIIYPKSCLACKKKLVGPPEQGLICAQCLSKIKKNAPPFCSCCGRRLEAKNIRKSICPHCQKTRLHFDRAFSPCVYTGVIKELIHDFKYKNKEHLGEPLSRLMIDFIKEFELPINYLDYIVPVPLHKTRLREREFNQAEVLTRHIAKEFNKEVLADALVRHKYTRTQTELETAKRLENVSGSFRVDNQKSLEGKNLLLVDDVLTSGATSSEAALTLKRAGAKIVFVLTLAN